MAPADLFRRPLGAHVIKPQIDAFNAAANGEMVIELYYADQLVPTSDLFLYNGLKEIWQEAYADVPNVAWLSTGDWDPLHIFTVNKPIKSLADMNGPRVVRQLSRQFAELGEGAAASEGALLHEHRPVALLPRRLVLGR